MKSIVYLTTFSCLFYFVQNIGIPLPNPLDAIEKIKNATSNSQKDPDQVKKGKDVRESGDGNQVVDFKFFK